MNQKNEIQESVNGVYPNQDKDMSPQLPSPDFGNAVAKIDAPLGRKSEFVYSADEVTRNLYCFLFFYQTHPDFFQSLTGKSPLGLLHRICNLTALNRSICNA